MKKQLSFLLGALALLIVQGFSVAQAAAVTVPVTFELDMTGVTPNANGIHITGSLNGWSPTATVLSPTDIENIYSVTLDLASGSNYDFKFMNGDAWGTEETVPAECAISTNRMIFVADADVAGFTVRYKYAGLPLSGFSKVIFNVDMGTTPATNGAVRITGMLNGWNSDNATMTQVGATTVWTITTYLRSALAYEYKFINGGSAWTNVESVPGDCAVNNNRLVTPDADKTVIDYFNACGPATALNEVSSSALSLYPSPVKDVLNINGLVDNSSIQIINAVGVVVSESTSQESVASINLSNLEAGIYLVKITNNATTVAKKIVKL